MKNIAFLLIALLGVSASAQEKKGSYDTFKLMKARNIFDPNRQPVRTEQPRDREQRESRTRPNWIALTGTMVTDDKALAFFNSSRADARKVAGVGEQVGEFKVLAVTPVQVEWEREGKRTVLAVGRQIETSGTTTELLEPSGPPVDGASEPPADGSVPAGDSSTPPRNGDSQSRDRDRDRDRGMSQRGDRGSQRDRGSSSRENAQPATNGAPSNSGSPASSDPSEVARKMMERRQKELTK
jgi:hypothetical protein